MTCCPAPFKVQRQIHQSFLVAAVQEVADLAAAGKFDYLVIESTGEAPTLAADS